jgi:hypothetical protein
MRLATDGAETPQNTRLGASAPAGRVTVDGTVYRSGLYSYKASDGEAYWPFPTGDLDEFYWRSGFRMSSLPITPLVFCPAAATYDQITIYVTADGVLQVKVGASIVDTYLGPLQTNTWYLLEVYCKIDDSVGVITVRLDGTQVATYSGDTKPSTYTGCGRARIKAGTLQSLWWDDVALNDTSGVADNSWCGEGHVIRLLPNGEGYLNQWMGSDGNKVNNYALVNELVSDEDVTYVESGTPGERDFHAVAAPPAGIDIQRVWVEARARDTAVGGPQIKLGLYKGGSSALSAAIGLLATYGACYGEELLVNPFTGLPWEVADFTGLQVGSEVV